MKEETIVTDVSDEGTLRDQAMKNILADRATAQEDEIEIDESLVDKEESHLEEEEALEEFVTLKVNGKTIEVSREKVEEAGGEVAYQKQAAASEKLRRAAELARVKEQELLQREKELVAMEQELLSKRDQEPDEFGREFADALFDDDEKVAKIVSSMNKKLEDVAAKQKKAEQAETIRAKDSEAKAARYYHEKYRDIASDPDMHLSLNRRLSGIREENPDYTLKQVVDEAATQVYNRFGKPETPEKVSVKSTMKTRPKMAAGRKPPPVENKPKTRGDILGEMRKGRGVHPY